MNDSRPIPEALAIAGLSAYSYALAYAYRSGFAQHFSLPPMLLSPTIGTVLHAALALGIALYGLFILANGVWMFVPRDESLISRGLRFTVAIGLLSFWVAFSTLDRLPALLVFLGATLGFAMIIFLPAIFSAKSRTALEERLQREFKVEAEAQKRTAHEVIAQVVGETNLQLFSAAALLLLFANLLGSRAAATEQVFYVSPKSSGYVAANLDETLVVLAGYDPATLTLNGNYRVEKFAEGQQHDFKLEYVGRLARHPRPKANAP